MAAQPPSNSQNLFDQLHFVVVRSTNLDDAKAEEIAQRLALYGGVVTLDRYPTEPIELYGVTHIISASADFPGYYDAVDSLIPVVRPQWVDDSVLKGRLAHTRQYSPDERNFMSDVVLCCADIPEGDADAIAGGVLAMGGNYTTKMTNLTTHIVALSMSHDFCEIVVQRKLETKIVLPHWFDDCLRLGRKIDEEPYTLPDPELLRHLPAKAPAGALNNLQISDALDPHPDKKALAATSRAPISVFKKKKFMLASDLGIGDYLTKILHDVIKTSEGRIVGDVSQADFYICKYRAGRDYRQALKRGTDIGNLAWLYYMIMHDRWTSPHRRLLHYPVPKQCVPGFKGLKISLSNYSGEARTYLENLAIAAGAECTKTLRQENTHLVTAHDQSEKCAAARDWNIHMVNHLWLEESYAKAQMLSVAVPRYTHFPRRTNLGDVVGQTEIDRAVLERVGPATADDSDTESPAVPEQGQPILQDEGVPMQAPTKGQAGKGRLLQKNERSGLKEELRTSVANRTAAPGKENVTPQTASSRKSKDRAAAKLHEMTPDIELYEKEKKRVGGVVYGGRRKTAVVEQKQDRKRSSDVADNDEPVVTESKKIKRGPAAITMHLLISGYKRWIGKAKEEDQDLKKLRDLGIVVVSEPSRATYLAIPHVVRTPKVVVALAYAPTIISTDFIDACLQKMAYLDPSRYLLKDSAHEKRLGVSLSVSNERAKANKNMLLQGRCIYCVEKIHGGFETIQGIVEANGGQCMTYRGRNGTMVPSRRAGSETTSDDDNEVYLLSSESPEDARFWPRFIKMAEGSRMTPRIVRSDWLLDTAMCQQIQPTATYEFNVDP